MSHEIFVVIERQMMYRDFNKRDFDQYDVYHSTYVDKELALKACEILQADSEACGDHWTKYIVSDDVIQYETPVPDPGLI